MENIPLEAVLFSQITDDFIKKSEKQKGVLKSTTYIEGLSFQTFSSRPKGILQPCLYWLKTMSFIEENHVFLLKTMSLCQKILRELQHILATPYT